MNSIAKPYAKAAFEYLSSEAKTRKVVEELLGFAALIDGPTAHSELSMICKSDVFSAESSREVVEGVAKAMKLSIDTERVLVVLADSRRLPQVKNVALALRQLLLQSEGIVSLKVETATELTKAEQKNVEDTFKKSIGKSVEATYQVVPGLLGGLKVTADGRTYDGSLLSGLQRIRESLVGG